MSALMLPFTARYICLTLAAVMSIVSAAVLVARGASGRRSGG